MQYTKDYSNGDQVRVFTESAVDLIAPFAHKTVATVAELEDAIANQIAGEVIFVQPGVYLLTKVLTPRYLANGGSLVGLGLVQIGGLAAAVAAINIIAYAGGTFQYHLAGNIECQGGTDKPALLITNGAITQKLIVYVHDKVVFVDNGAGVAVKAINTGTGAMRMYVEVDQGTTWETVVITQKNADDKWHFTGLCFDSGLTAGNIAVADSWQFINCQLAHAGMAGGNAASVVNCKGCWTLETTAFAAADAADFPGGFNPVLIP